MKNFAAIDFETANASPTSVCSVGIVIVHDGEMVDSFYSLIKPEPEYYDFWCSQVHAVTKKLRKTMSGKTMAAIRMMNSNTIMVRYVRNISKRVYENQAVRLSEKSALPITTGEQAATICLNLFKVQDNACIDNSKTHLVN